MNFKTFLACFLLAITFVGCQTTSTKKKALEEIVPKESEKPLTEKLSANIANQYGKLPSERKAKSFQEFTAALLKKLHKTEIKIEFLNTNHTLIASAFTPVIYISKGLIEEFEYENEMAFFLAMQIYFIQEKVTSQRYALMKGEQIGENFIVLPTNPMGFATPVKEPVSKGWFDKDGLFDFGLDAYALGIQKATALIHEYNYDPRGGVNFFRRLGMKSLFPAFPDTTAALNIAREEVARMSPLKDPVVKTKEFDLMRKNLRK